MSKPEANGARRLTKTRTPGIYKRGDRFVVVYRDRFGKQRKAFASTLAEARDLKAQRRLNRAKGEESRTLVADYARIREAMELQAQTVTMITAAVDETALAADSMSSTIAAIRSDTENVAADIDQVEQGFGRFSEQIANFKSTAKAFVNGMAA